MIPFIYCDSLQQLGIKHGFTTRNGGVSSGVFESLNSAKKENDPQANVIENRRRIAITFQTLPENLTTVKQIHSNKVAIVDENWSSNTLTEADAIVTKIPNKLLGIQTADCVPILLADPKNQVIAAVHAGWKGAVNGIIQNTIEAMVACGAQPAFIHAAIGPCIWQKSYEVDQSFYNNLNHVTDLFIKSHRPDHWLFDLSGFINHTFKKLKICHISPSKYDTYTNPEMFFSFRRKTHLNEPSFGCSLSVIRLG